MRYKDALEFVEKNQVLKGTVDENGFLVGDIVIVPSDSTKRDSFLQKYTLYDGDVLCTFNDDEDVQVWAVDTAYLKKANVLFYNNLAD